MTVGLLSFGRGLLESKRSAININGPDTANFAFIDHTKQADNWLSPVSNSFSGLSFSNYVDSNGWPNSATASGKTFGGGIRIPGTDSFSGPYVLTWTGDGTVEIVWGGTAGLTWTANTSTPSGDTTGTYTRVGNQFTNATGQTARVIINASGMPGPMQPPYLRLDIKATGGTGGFLRNLQFYRYEDEADLLAGKIFRTGFKQAYIDNNSRHVRFLDWTSTNDNIISRFEHRNAPSYAAWFNNYGAVGQPAYGTTSGTRAFTLTGVTGTPASMQHGELATCLIGSSVAKAGQLTISGITKANPGVVNVTAHGFSNGDVVIHYMTNGIPGNSPAGMTQLHCVPCTVTVIDADHYSIGVDTSAYTPFSIGVAYYYCTMQVGSGNDRTAYPLVQNDGISPVTRFGAGYWMTAGNYETFTFDKLLQVIPGVTGAWMVSKNSNTPLNDGVPIEICTQFVNELMAMNPKNAINMYVNIPPRGMVSTDPDYSAASNYPVKMVTAIMNGANGYAALDSRCNLYVEPGNETWNNGTFNHAIWLQQVGYQTGGLSSLGNDLSTYATIRAKQTVQDIQAAFPGNSRIKYVMGMFTTLGASDPRNQIRTRGNSSTGTSPAPLSYFDAIAIAGYFSNGDGTGSPPPTPNTVATCQAAYFAAIGNPSAQEAAFSAFAQGFAQQSIGGNETIDRYVSLLSGYATEAAILSKKVVGYEGGIEIQFTDSRGEKRGTFHSNTSLTGIDNNDTLTAGYYIIGSGIPAYTTISSSSAGSATLSAAASFTGVGYFIVASPSDYFSLLFKNSQSWATSYLTWFNAWNSVANAEAPADFILYWVNRGRWSHTFYPDSYNASTTERSGFDAAWAAMSARNKS
jgi:hypothetical protein